MRRGVSVLAAADGVVLAMRDGEADHMIVTAADREATRGREYGNGVLLGHGGGWQTQYCHMGKGSIAVHIGQPVKAGDKLGLVGVSGDSQFPHVHFAVRQFKRKVDPFAPELDPGKCGPNGGHPLWSASVGTALAWRGSEVINTGFASAPLTMADVDEERSAAPARDAAALVFWGRAIGLQGDDRVTLQLVGPDGRPIAESTSAIDHVMAQWLGLAGHRTPVGGWPHGNYKGSMTIIRNGLIAATRTGTITL